MQYSYYNPFGQNDNNQNDQNERYIKEIDLKINQKKELLSAGFSLGFAIILSLVLQSCMGIFLNALGVANLYRTNSLFFSSFNSIGISIISIAVPFGLIAYFNRKYFLTPLIPSKRIGFFKTVLWVNFGSMACIIINLFVSQIIVIAEQLGYKLNNAETPKVDSAIACILLVISTAIMPGVCEEFAMRCCSLGLLRRQGKGFAIFAVSLIFGLLHGNVVQFIFAFLVGSILAYVTVQTDNILPAIFIHAINNGRSVIYDICEFAKSTDFADTVVTNLTYYLLVAGAISGIILLLTRQFAFNRQRKENDVLPFGKKLLYLLPGLALPLLLLIATTIATIEKL